MTGQGVGPKPTTGAAPHGGGQCACKRDCPSGWPRDTQPAAWVAASGWLSLGRARLQKLARSARGRPLELAMRRLAWYKDKAWGGFANIMGRIAE